MEYLKNDSPLFVGDGDGVVVGVVGVKTSEGTEGEGGGCIFVVVGAVGAMETAPTPSPTPIVSSPGTLLTPVPMSMLPPLLSLPPLLQAVGEGDGG